MGRSSNRPPLDRLTKALGYAFNDPVLLERALTHRSAASENNERLEFLGDAALEYVISTELFHRYPRCKEGDLSRLRATLVRGETLAEIAKRLQLGEYLKLGPGELKSGGFRRTSILADALEAIFGAISLDGGFEAVRSVILHLYEPSFASLPDLEQLKDPKTRLQEVLQSRRLPLPSYRILREEGDRHARTYVVACEVALLPEEVEGRGSSRRKAEQAAAETILERLKCNE